MTKFLKSFSPILKKLKKYLVEFILLFVAIIITIVSFFIYTGSNQTIGGQAKDFEAFSSLKSNQAVIFVDVSGAVKKPNLYQINYGARIKEVVDKAGGLSENADVLYFNRNFNFARIVSDQEKIYIPSISEINNGVFIQNQLSFDYISPVTNVNTFSTTDNTATDGQLININSGTIEELDQLPGIGQVTANKIISNRPYATFDELIIKKAINKNVFDKIKNLITL